MQFRPLRLALCLLVLSFLAITCTQNIHTLQEPSKEVPNQKIVSQIAMDPDFVYIAYALNKDYLKLRMAVYAPDSTDADSHLAETRRVAKFFFYYSHRLQEKYHLRNTTAYLKAANKPFLRYV